MSSLTLTEALVWTATLVGLGLLLFGLLRERR